MNSFFEKALTDRPELLKTAPIDNGDPAPICPNCREAQIDQAGDLCPNCKREKARGYSVSALLGRLANGAERDHGIHYHAVPLGTNKALCGAKPGRRSVGWSTYFRETVTCPECLKKLGGKSE